MHFDIATHLGCNASSTFTVVIPAESGDPVRRGFSIHHYRLWNTGSPDHRRAEATPSFGRLCRAMTVVIADVMHRATTRMATFSRLATVEHPSESAPVRRYSLIAM